MTSPDPLTRIADAGQAQDDLGQAIVGLRSLPMGEEAKSRLLDRLLLLGVPVDPTALAQGPGASTVAPAQPSSTPSSSAPDPVSAPNAAPSPSASLGPAPVPPASPPVVASAPLPPASPPVVASAPLPPASPPLVASASGALGAGAAKLVTWAVTVAGGGALLVSLSSFSPRSRPTSPATVEPERVMAHASPAPCASPSVGHTLAPVPGPTEASLPSSYPPNAASVEVPRGLSLPSAAPPVSSERHGDAAAPPEAALEVAPRTARGGRRPPAPKGEPRKEPSPRPGALEPPVDEAAGVVRRASVDAPPASAAREAFPRKESEVALVKKARESLASSPATALRLAEEHASEYPNGVLRQEREFLAISALVRLGRVEQARARARALRRDFPQSAYLPSLARLLSP